MTAKNKIPESKVVEAVEKLFLSNGYEEHFTEVKFCERSIDLFARKESVHIAVEAKISAVTKAFTQAIRYRYVADYLYVALPKNSSNKKAFELSLKTGIGIIFVEGESDDSLFAYYQAPSRRFNHKIDEVTDHIWENKKRALNQ